MKNAYYKLEGTKAVECTDVKEWAEIWDTRAFRRVAQEVRGGVCVSTVFLGLDHQVGDGPPLLFETVVFGGKHPDSQERYSTWEEAEAGHARWVAKVWP